MIFYKDTGTDGCIAVKTVVKDFGTEMSWSIGGTCENKEGYFENKEYTQKCCVAEGSTITCQDSFGDGWHGGYLEIDGQKYCDIFSSGYKFSVKLNSDDSDGSGGDVSITSSTSWDYSTAMDYTTMPW